MSAAAARVEAPIEQLEVSAYTIPTDFPESDGTFSWRQTTLVLVEATAGGVRGLGYSYADIATAQLVQSALVDVVHHRDAVAVPAAWEAMVHQVRNLGRPGVCSMAVAGVDSALWDLKARLLDLPLVTLLGAAHRSVPVYGSGGFTSYSIQQFQDQLGGWVADGIPRVKMKIGTHPDEWLLVEFGGHTKEEADAQARKLMDRLKKAKNAPRMRLYDNPADEKKTWTVRRSGLGATAHVPGKEITWEGWEDASVPPDKLGGYLRDFRKLLDRYGYEGDLYGHFGQGCVHTRIDFDLETADGIRHYRSFLDEAANLVVSYGGSISGEHGDGQSKAALLPKMFGPELIQAFHEFKSIWDQAWKMNPG
jgi:hypothetical protein